MLRWPSRAVVDREVRRWASRIAKERTDLVRVGLFGSYARGDAGVGSDIDIVAIVSKAGERPEERIHGWDTVSLPVPTDLLVYTEAEWARIKVQGRFGATVCREIVWLYERAS